MSDDPRETKRKMEKVFLCNEIWFDCLPFLSRAKVGFEFALVSDRFDGLANAHLGSKKRPWTLGKLNIREEQDNVIIVKNFLTENEEHLPFPEEPLPNNVIGFESISIRYIDHKVIDFLRRIRRLFQPKNNGNDGIGLVLDIHSSYVRSLDIFCDSIWPLVNPFAITKLYFSWNTFDEFRRRISSTFLLDWANVHMLSTSFYVPFGSGKNGQLLRQWLYTPREDGKPKLLDICMDSDVLELLKTEFLSTQSAVNFIISFFMYGPDLFVPFELDNWRTGERLTFRKFDMFKWLLERGPIVGRDAEKWDKWVGEAIDIHRDHNELFIRFGDNDIGFLGEIAGPSGQHLQK